MKIEPHPAQASNIHRWIMVDLFFFVQNFCLLKLRQGTLDALLIRPQPFSCAAKALREIQRVLKVLPSSEGLVLKQYFPFVTNHTKEAKVQKGAEVLLIEKTFSPDFMMFLGYIASLSLQCLV